MQKKFMYKILFVNQSKVYEVYAEHIAQSGIFGFIEISGFVFGEKSSVVIDPAEEKLKSEFQDVKRTYIPMHSVIRIDEVEKEGVAKITPIEGKADQIISFPGGYYGPPTKPKGDT